MPSSQAIRAGAAYIELYTKDSKLVKGLDRAAARLKAFGDGITSVGKKFAAQGAAITTPLVGAAKVFADMGSDLVDMSQRTGLSVESLSELGFAAGQTGSDIATLETGLRRMQRSILDASDGLASAKDAFAHLGLAVDQLKGLSPEEQFKLIADRLSKVKDATMRAGVAMVLLGRSGTRLLPLFQEGAAGIEELQRNARELGLTISTQDAAAAEAFGDEIAALWTVLKRSVFTIGSALEPLLSKLADTVTRVAVRVSAWIAENRQLVVTVFKFGAATLAAGAGLVVLGTAIKGLGIALGGIGTLITTAGAAVSALVTIFGSLLSPIGLVIGGVAALAAYIIYATGAGGQALAWLGGQFGALKDDALSAWKGIGDAMAAGDLALAAKIVWLTLKMEWQKGINFLEAAWLDFKGFFVSVWQKAVFGIASFMTDAWAGIQVAWLETVSVLASAWTNFIGLLKKGWNHFAGFFQKVWARIKGLFSDTNPDEEIARINDEVSKQDQNINAQRDAKLAEREQARREQRQQIESDRAGAQSALDDMQTDEQHRREEKNQAALKASGEELAKARGQWQDALKSAAEKRAEADAKGPHRLKGPELPAVGDLDSLVEGVRRKIEVAGSFNPLAARGLGADSLSERTAKATEQVAANTKQLVREAKQGGMVFG
ncbi:MAG TPA: hypothetical protein VFW87_02205 [Pirellulales bacterium]|nr:hypothetical protein [Pirellulales bacterium]